MPVRVPSAVQNAFASAVLGRRPALVLELDLTEPLLEAAPQDPLSTALAYRRGQLRDVLDGLRRAAGDSPVRALVGQVGGERMGLGRAQDLRDAVEAFRGSGKPAIAWAETFGEFGPGTVPYYLATGFDEIWLQPSGGVGLTGFAGQAPFLRDALDKLGVVPEYDRRREYKNAPDTFLERQFTPAFREAVARLIASLSAQVVDGVAEGRRLDPSTVRSLVDRAPLAAEEALAAGLVDRLGYRDEVYDDVRARAGEDAELRYVVRYQRESVAARAKRLRHRKDPVVALVHGIGAVSVGRSGRSPVGGVAMGADTVTAAFRAAARDDSVAAVVFRVDSPGGSYIASDAIRRGVLLARKAGKPVVVSMCEVAASGGYFVSMPADVIVAQPGTATGSIGVWAGKTVVSGLLNRVGVSFDGVAEGEHAWMFSSTRSFSADEWAWLERWLDHVYADFTGKVAADRGLPAAHVESVARGRVWTGSDALEAGLVDELGGFEHAVGLARERAGLRERDGDLRVFPRVSPIDRVRPARSSEDPAAAAAALRLGGWGQFADLAARVGLPAAGPLVLPGAVTIR